MNSETIVYCVVALLLGMLLTHMLKDVCGCKTIEGQIKYPSQSCRVNYEDGITQKDINDLEVIPNASCSGLVAPNNIYNGQTFMDLWLKDKLTIKELQNECEMYEYNNKSLCKWDETKYQQRPNVYITSDMDASIYDSKDVEIIYLPRIQSSVGKNKDIIY